MPDFDGRIAIITGGASGIGRACAEALAARGARVAVCDAHADGARAAADAIVRSGGRAGAWTLDVTDPAAVRGVFESIGKDWGPAGILVTCAGIPGHGALTELTDDVWTRVHRVNLDGVFHCMREALRQMLPARRGAIVNVSSLCGIMGCASSPAYSSAKAGVIGLSKAAARRHTADGIRINVVAPGLVDTPFVEPDRAMGKLAGGIAKVPLGRMGTPREIAALVAFLCSDEAAFIAGQVISPNGGQLI